MMKEMIKAFLSDANRKRVMILYDGKKMNASCDWYRFRNPWMMLFRGFLNEVLMKIPPCSLKNHLYRVMGVKIGKDVAICPDVSLDPLFPELITIEDGVTLGWGCRVFAHGYFNDRIILGRVVIKRMALVGGYSLIIPGVTVGEEAMIALCSLVRKDVKGGEAVAR